MSNLLISSNGSNRYSVIKDKSLRLRGANQAFLEDYALSEADITGIPLVAVVPHPYEHLDEAYDRDILAGKRYRTVQLFPDQQGKLRYFHKQSLPDYDVDGQCVGIKTMLHPLKIKTLEAICADIAFIGKHYACHYLHIGQDLFNALSPEESEVFFYLIRGWTISDIAIQLNKATLRVEELKDLVFHKTMTTNRRELFSYAIKEGLLCHVPETLVTRGKRQNQQDDSASMSTPALALTHQVNKLVKPILDETLDFFAYARGYNDGRRVYLSTHLQSDGLLRFLDESNQDKHQNTVHSESIDDGLQATSQVVLFENIQHDSVRPWPKSAFVLSVTHHHYQELFCFGSSQKTLTLRAYARDEKRLQNFCLYFKGQAEKLCLQAEKTTTPATPLWPNPTFFDEHLDPAKLDLVLSLSDRELAVLSRIARAVPSKIIGNQLGVSEKTINEYVRRLRVKFNCHTTYALTQVYWTVASS